MQQKMAQETHRPQAPEGLARGVCERFGPAGAARALVLCEHASNRFPPEFGELGLDARARESHAAWDPGARDLARRLGEDLDAPVVASTVSRLVYDCNRPPSSPTAMPAQSERIEVPGNRDLSPEARAARVERVYEPFMAAVREALETSGARALVTVHSFTPVYDGVPRAVEIGVLHDSDTRLADALLARAGARPPFDLRRNEPYGPEDGVTHSLKVHGIERGIPNVMIEVRNDLLASPEGVDRVARWLAPLVAGALDDMLGAEPQGRAG